jgi:mono/diheme cytochrome c family protein
MATAWWCNAASRPPRRSTPKPGSELPAEFFVTVITNGIGRMLPMAERIPPADRWAIAAYVKALQLARQETEDGQ